MSRFFGISLAAVATFATLAQAQTGDRFIRRDVSVSYADLDLTTDRGAAIMLNRIKHAAVEACGGSPYFNSLYETAPGYVMTEFRKCHDNAVDKAVALLHSPALVRLYAESRGERFDQYAGR
jgi:UrcA family protein